MSTHSPAWTTVVDVHALAAALTRMPPRLVDARALAAVRVVDARFSLADPQSGAQAYAQAHLPGAVHADLDRDLADLAVTGHGRHPLPDVARFTRRLGQWGIAEDTQVVVYDAGDGSMAAARLWWLLRLLGHRSVAVLDGGLVAWQRAGLPVTAELPQIAALPPYPAQFDAAQVVSAEEVLARLPAAPGWLLDARAGERYRGEVEPIDPVAGHVPGAVNRPLAQNLVDGHLRPPTELHDELRALLNGYDPAQVVVMCGSGVTACHLLLALEHAGLGGARVFADSWSGWIADPARPRVSG